MLTRSGPGDMTELSPLNIESRPGSVRCDYMFVTGECHAVTRHVSRHVISVIAIVRNPSVILTFLIFTPCYLVSVCKEIFLGNNAVMHNVSRSLTRNQRGLGTNVWVIQFNKSDKISSHVTFVFCGCHQHELIWLDF